MLEAFTFNYDVLKGKEFPIIRPINYDVPTGFLLLQMVSILCKQSVCTIKPNTRVLALIESMSSL